MTAEQYKQQNLKGYEGDSFIHAEIKSLVEKFGINQIIETGTYLGGTTNRLAEFCQVHTVEIKKEHYDQAKRNLKPGIYIQHGNSTDVLKDWLPKMKGRNILLFLDAHWEDYWPLKDELKVIADNKIKPVIIIHDFKVPDTDFGFDSYKGEALDIAYIEESLKEIYPEGYGYHYNTQADGAKRGVIYIYPEPSEEKPERKKRGRKPKAK